MTAFLSAMIWKMPSAIVTPVTSGFGYDIRWQLTCTDLTSYTGDPTFIVDLTDCSINNLRQNTGTVYYYSPIRHKNGLESVYGPTFLNNFC